MQLREDKLNEAWQYKGDDEEGMFLSVDWSSRLQGLQLDSQIVVSTQAGNIKVFDVSDDIRTVSTFVGHSIGGSAVPAWIAAFDPHSRQTVVSGGDDMIMRLWDLRSGQSISTKHHQAGVTAAQWHPSLENIFASGSYDEAIRVWDRRSLKDPLLYQETGGGVWRVKWHSDSSHCYIVVASMHAGARVYETSADISSISLVASRDGSDPDKHLLYGIDVLIASPSSTKLASCSFYENKIEIWDFYRKHAI
jgi:diphthamide biosynthesis protein 7